MNVNVMTIWEDEKQVVSPIGEMKNRFFVRIRKDEKEKVEEVFENPEFIDAGIDGEIGFLTEEMAEDNFEKTISGFDGFLSRIRVGFNSLCEKWRLVWFLQDNLWEWEWLLCCLYLWWQYYTL